MKFIQVFTLFALSFVIHASFLRPVESTFSQNAKISNFKAFAKTKSADCSNIEWKNPVENNIQCGEFLVGGVMKRHYCESAKTQWCVASTSGQGSTCQALKPASTALIIADYSYVSLPSDCYCLVQLNQEDVSPNSSIACGLENTSFRYCPSFRPFCTSLTTGGYSCNANEAAEDSNRASWWNASNYPNVCKHVDAISTKPWDFYTEHDLKDTRAWRMRLASIYRVGVHECPNYKLNIMNEHDRCGVINGENYFCAGYNTNMKYFDENGNCTDAENCGTPKTENYCVPTDGSEDMNHNTCAHKHCHCVVDAPIAGTHLNTWDNASIEQDCQARYEYLLDYSKVRMWDDYIAHVADSAEDLNKEQELFERSRCPFVRTIITVPPPPPPRKPCEESFNLSNSLIHSARITWIETHGFTHIEFMPEAAKIAANGVCAYSFKITEEDPSKLVDEFGLSRISLSVDCTEQSVKSAICYDIGSQVNLMLNNIVTHLVDSIQKGWAEPSPNVCYEKTGIWSFNNKALQDFSEEVNTDNRRDLEFTGAMGWNYHPWNDGPQDHHYKNIDGYNGAGYHVDISGEFPRSFEFQGKGTSTSNLWGMCMCPSGRMYPASDRMGSRCGQLKWYEKAYTDINELRAQGYSDEMIAEHGPSLLNVDQLSTAQKDVFWNKFPVLHCYNGAALLDDVNNQFDQCQEHTNNSSYDIFHGSNMIVECGQREEGYEQCGNVNFDGVEHQLSCPHTAHRCCSNRGAEFKNSFWTTGNRCSFTCHNDDEVQGFRSRDFFESFHTRAHEILSEAKEEGVDSYTFFNKTFKTPRFRAPGVYENTNFCVQDFKKEANSATLEHYYLKTMPWLLMKDLMEHCSKNECHSESLTVNWIKKWATSEGRLGKKIDPSKLCTWVQDHFTSCMENNAIQMIAADGTPFPVMTSKGDPTKMEDIHKNMWTILNCNHLPMEPITNHPNSDVIPGYRNHCETVMWQRANDGAFLTFMKSTVQYLRNTDVTLNIEDILNSEGIRTLKNQALASYCSVFSKKIYEQLLALTTNDGQHFTPRMLTHFIDFCESKCMHTGQVNPLFDVNVGDKVAESQTDILTPTMDLFSPEQRNENDEQLSQWYKYSQKSTFWDKHPNYNRRKIAIKMGIKINDYLRKLQKKTKLWNYLDEDSCVVDGVTIKEETKLLDCFARQHNVYYDMYPAYRHESSVDGDHHYTQCKDTGVGAQHSTFCKCVAPTQRTCIGSKTEISQCKVRQFNEEIKPYFMCLMRRRLEGFQKIWLFKNWEWFRTKHKDQNENSRVPSMLRKEMGERYCQEFCNAFTLDHDLHGTAASEHTWRTNTCFNACSQSFSRCHTTEKCMKNEWFNAVQDTEGRFHVDEISAYNAGTCSPKIHYYNNCSLHKRDRTYWSDNFQDLLRLCNLRSRRNHLGQLFNNADLSGKCSALRMVGEDGKCYFNDDNGTEQWRHCNTWAAPHCNMTTGLCDNSTDSANIKTEYSIPTAWNQDAD